jgi:adenylate cyclase
MRCSWRPGEHHLLAHLKEHGRWASWPNFASVVDAVRCAVELQRGMVDRNTNMPEDKRIAFRVGINLGDVIADNDDIFGDGVNIAARLEALAEPGGICVARTVRNQIRDKLPYPFEDLGEQTVKNIARPVRADAISAAAVASTPLVGVLARPSPAPRPLPSRPAVIAASAAVVVAIGAAAWWAWPNRNPSTALVQAIATGEPANHARRRGRCCRRVWERYGLPC